MLGKILKTRFVSTIVMVTMFIAALYMVSALVPLAPSTFTEGQSETLNSTQYTEKTQEAYAGNITNITIHSRSQTKHWQGYWGDITGTIVLDDAQNYTLYDWPNPEPKGEIYATPNQTVPNWGTLECFNFTGGADGLGNLTEWENFYNMTWNDVDGINETFNMTTHEAIDVGDVVTILTDTCPSTFMHMSDVFQEDKWSEVLLQDDQGMLIYTAIIENDDEANNTDIQGFKSLPASFDPDFQMIVAEDGTSRTGGQINTATTTYYFYVDLE